MENTTVDKLKRLAEERKKESELSGEEFNELKKACQYVFSTREGKILGNYMMKVSGIYKFPNFSSDPHNALRKEGLIYFYLFFIKGMCDAKTIMDIETRGVVK